MALENIEKIKTAENHASSIIKDSQIKSQSIIFEAEERSAKLLIETGNNANIAAKYIVEQSNDNAKALYARIHLGYVAKANEITGQANQKVALALATIIEIVTSK